MLSGEGSPSQFDDDIRGFAVEVGIDPAVAILVHRLDEVHQIPGSCNIVRWDHFFAFFAKSPFRFPHQTRTIIASGNSSFSAVTEVTEEAWRTAILALMSLLGVCLNEWWSEWSEVVVATYAPLAYSSAVVFVETPIFSRRVGNYLDDDENGRLQSFLAAHPEAGKVIRGSGGMRKLRWAGSSWGKRGGLRIIYFWWVSRDRISMLMVYPKSEQDDLTPGQLKQLKRQLTL